jgi:hypothetical protein
MLKKSIQNVVGVGVVTLGLGACASSTPSSTMVLQGAIKMKGSMPHTSLVIEDKKSHKSYKIQNQEAFGLAQKQNQTLSLEVALVKDAIGPGFPAEVEVKRILP